MFLISFVRFFWVVMVDYYELKVPSTETDGLKIRNSIVCWQQPILHCCVKQMSTKYAETCTLLAIAIAIAISISIVKQPPQHINAFSIEIYLEALSCLVLLMICVSCVEFGRLSFVVACLFPMRMGWMNVADLIARTYCLQLLGSFSCCPKGFWITQQYSILYWNEFVGIPISLLYQIYWHFVLCAIQRKHIDDTINDIYDCSQLSMSIQNVHKYPWIGVALQFSNWLGGRSSGMFDLTLSTFSYQLSFWG